MTPAHEASKVGLRRIERHVTGSVHWGFPLAPAITWALLALPLRDPVGGLLPTAVLAVAVWGALALLHTRLRARGHLSASWWDRIAWLRDDRPAWAAWIIGSISWVALAGPALGGLPDVLGGFVAGFNASLLAAPMLVLGRPALAYVGNALLVCLLVRDVPLDGPDPRLVAAAVWGTTIGIAILISAHWLLDMLRTTKQLDRARRDAARLAVAEERLRFSRDLHDVYGRTLSAVALKAELAAAQAELGRPEAPDTMRAVQAIATEALNEVRGIVRGYRDIDLVTEIAGARSLLESAGIQVTTVNEVAQLPGPVLRTLAWVVREGATNILRHSSATRARFALHHDADGARLIVTNDRTRTPSSGAGSGLTGLAERLADIGGTLAVHRAGDEFTLTAGIGRAALELLDTAAEEGTPA